MSVPGARQQNLDRIEAAKDLLHRDLAGQPWLRGIGIGAGQRGSFTIAVRVATGAAHRVPRIWKGWTVDTVEVDYMPRTSNPAPSPRRQLTAQKWHRVEDGRTFFGHALETPDGSSFYRAWQMKDLRWKLEHHDNRTGRAKVRIVARAIPDFIRARVAVLADQAEQAGRPIDPAVLERLAAQEYGG